MGMAEVGHYQALPWEGVESSNLRRVAFVEVSEMTAEEARVRGTLYVEFHDGRAYLYSKVSRETYEEMLEADSVGAYFAREVRPHHEFEKIER
jgi:KTSC domain